MLSEIPFPFAFKPKAYIRRLTHGHGHSLLHLLYVAANGNAMFWPEVWKSYVCKLMGTLMVAAILFTAAGVSMVASISLADLCGCGFVERLPVMFLGRTEKGSEQTVINASLGFALHVTSI